MDAGSWIARTPVFAGALLFAVLLVACGGAASEADGAASAPAPLAALDGAAVSAPDFPTGPAVTVPVGYEPPTDRVDSTGAYLPVNGKPTLVFLEAIW